MLSRSRCIAAVLLAITVIAVPACGGSGAQQSAPAARTEKPIGPLGGEMAYTSATQSVETLTYANNQRLDVYRDTRSTSAALQPAALLIHGGGWAAGDRTEFKYLAQWLAQNKVVPIAIDYRLTSQGHQWPAQAQDVEQAMWWVREHAAALHIDPSKVTVIGGSAGGHLAAWLGTTDARNGNGTSSHANRIVSLWGPWDLSVDRSELIPDANNMIAALMGSQDPKAASPMLRISSSAAPALLIHGSADTLVPASQSTRACAALQQAGQVCELLILQGEGHGLSMDKNVPVVIDAVGRFMSQPF